VTTWRWVLLDEAKSELRSSEEFESRDDAEQWLTTEWPALRDEGAASVSLRSDSDEIYEMSLADQ
jgi:hypothetical protein